MIKMPGNYSDADLKLLEEIHRLTKLSPQDIGELTHRMLGYDNRFVGGGPIFSITGGPARQIERVPRYEFPTLVDMIQNGQLEDTLVGTALHFYEQGRYWSASIILNGLAHYCNINGLTHERQQALRNVQTSVEEKLPTFDNDMRQRADSNIDEAVFGRTRRDEPYALIPTAGNQTKLYVDFSRAYFIELDRAALEASFDMIFYSHSHSHMSLRPLSMGGKMNAVLTNTRQPGGSLIIGPSPLDPKEAKRGTFGFFLYDGEVLSQDFADYDMYASLEVPRALGKTAIIAVVKAS
ncbi:MAG TPA: hypothetical protein VI934_04060 [Candidatus Nanoarchaeia archaeon]|nr:hypothetical protein [Candidatus Nanoarchaeia archaeon]